MHESSLRKIEILRDVYAPSGCRVLDVGSQAHLEQDSYRPLFDGFDYVGLDIEAGPNVDLVPADPFAWTELADESFDVVVCGQALEHNPYPWITLAEIARVLAVGGVAGLVAPSTGPVHRFPLDCWRFYPDGLAALCGYVGLEVVESYVEPTTHRWVEGAAAWGDAFTIARRPEHLETERLRAIVATRCPSPEPTERVGPAIRRYEDAVVLTDEEWQRRIAPPRRGLRRVIGAMRRIARPPSPT